MFIRLERRKNTYERISKLGHVHKYERSKQVAVLHCDECDQVFERDLKHIDRKRLDDNYFHCCDDCDSRRFGQRKSVESKKLWDLSTGEDIPLSKY